MKKSMLPAIALMALSQIASADSVQPQFDLSGNWLNEVGLSASYFQEGNQLSFVYVTAGTKHHFVGRYTSSKLIEGIQHRVSRTTGCATAMRLRITALTADSLSIASTALDSSCDLVRGQQFVNTANRIP